MAVRESVHALDICPACGTENTRDARFCRDCQEPLRVTRALRTFEFCTIALWRGYRSTTFYAADEDGVALLESKPFRFKGEGTPPDEAAPHEAYAWLLAALEADGWAPDGVECEPWYATRLERGSDVPVLGAPLLPAPREPIAPRTPVAPTKQPAAKAVSEPIEPTPEPLKSARKPRRRPSLVLIIFCAGVALTIGALAAWALGYGAHQTTVLRAVGPAATPKVVWTGASASAQPKTAPAHAPQAAVRVSIMAKQTSWLEIRNRSATGRVLYSGELAAGRRLHFRGTRLWSRFGSAGNLAITANGRPVTLSGTYEHIFLASKR